MKNLLSRYFNWLQKDNPTGGIDLFPELSENGETSLKGVYIVGDLTGIPLLKFAAAGGAQIIQKFASIHDRIATKKQFDKMADDVKNRGAKSDSGKNEYEFVIIGAGPAGISAALEAQKRGISYIVLEASERLFNTIQDFPKGKPMFYEPMDMEDKSPLTMKGDNKEQLIQHFEEILAKQNVQIKFNQKVKHIEALAGNKQKIVTDSGDEFFAHKTILAIGKSGNARKLGVKGEDLPHVFTKLFDPHDYNNKKILVVGGGDSAVESAMLLAQAGNDVTLSYRKDSLTRPKPDNILKFNQMVEAGQMNSLLGSNVLEIRKGEVDIAVGEKEVTQQYDNVFLLIGRQLPYEFFAKCGIKIENAKTKMTYWWMAFSVAFANIIYFGKASDGITGYSGVAELTNIFTGSLSSIIFKTVSWVSVLVFIVTGVVVLFDLLRNWKKYFSTKWAYIKNGYFAFTLVLFLVSFFGDKYFDFNLGQKDPYFWYGFLYTTTILLFGIRRISVTKTKYVTQQTILLFLIQALPLFIIPNFVLPWMHDAQLIHPWIVENVFFGGEWWRFVGFILAWPLFIWNIFTDQPSMFWLIVSLLQTFVIIPWLVIRWGKGAYCSWICSCGAMAETLGDEYRTLAAHGPRAKKLENFGQIVLFSIFIISFLHMLGWVPSFSGTLAGINKALLDGYKIIVDTFLAGTVGVGLYFFYSGRVWCRFACPLAALMHIYNKFAVWRILADKKKCISCGLCTKNCHMGIDVMNYANKGKPLDDVECVNCSACINVCPTGVLSFGKYKKIWNKDAQ